VNRRTLARVARSAAVGLLALGLTACTGTYQVTTNPPYSVTDGLNTTIGPVTAVNLLVVSAAKGDPGALTGAFTNSSDRAVTLSLALADQSGGASVEIGAGQTVYVGAGTDRGVTATFDAVPAAPGQVVGLTLSSPATGSSTVQVPVLDGTLPEYATLVPTPSPSAS
jgi:hypothetical protein